MIHKLKILKPYYDAIRDGSKRFEIRENDRDFKVGDTLELQLYDATTRKYSGETLHVKVLYMFQGNAMRYGIADNTCILSISDPVPGPTLVEGLDWGWCQDNPKESAALIDAYRELRGAIQDEVILAAPSQTGKILIKIRELEND